MFNDDLNDLLKYAVKNNLIKEEDKIYAANAIITLFEEHEFLLTKNFNTRDLTDILKSLVDYGVNKGLLEDTASNRDLFDISIMNVFVDRPSNIIKEFYKKHEESPTAATEYYYKLSVDSNYIRKDRIKKDIKRKINTEYGEIDLNINLSKPEKDPRDIIKSIEIKKNTYPKCFLCKENEGFKGNINYQSKENLRAIPLTLNNSKWFIQYSPYVYYDEHCIVFSEKHIPMKINQDTFVDLIDFTKVFPYYFLGSNAGIPIVGGSILNHLHYQGGKSDFPIFSAETLFGFKVKKFENIKCEVLNWPVSVVKLSSVDEKNLINLGEKILKVWENYSDENVNIIAFENGERHNTVTPIVRKNGEVFELYIAFRNNITTKDRPMGYFHPQEKYHNIKKENIGLIEVMGLAVLPGRLKTELECVKDYILFGENNNIEVLSKHSNLVKLVENKSYKDEKELEEFIYAGVGEIFIRILEDTAVFKKDEIGRDAFREFLEVLNKKH